MKKSEMVQLIIDTFEYEGLGSVMRYKDALVILDTLLQAGLKPPVVTYDPVLLRPRYGWEKEE